MIGSFEETGLDTRFCFEKTARSAPYGIRGLDSKTTASTEENVDKGEDFSETTFWGNVRWGHLQQQCITSNQQRYKAVEMPENKRFSWRKDRDHDDAEDVLITSSNDVPHSEGNDGKGSLRWWMKNRTEYKKKSALVLRAYDGLKWTPKIIQHVRSYVMELSLHSGGEYEVIILSEAKDRSKRIFDDEDAYREALLGAAPLEFRDMIVLFNQDLLEQWYPLVGKHE